MSRSNRVVNMLRVLSVLIISISVVFLLNELVNKEIVFIQLIFNFPILLTIFLKKNTENSFIEGFRKAITFLSVFFQGFAVGVIIFNSTFFYKYQSKKQVIN